MTTTQIETLFFEVLEEKAVYKKLEGISEDKVYNWRKVRGPKPTIGDMLNVLYQLQRITVFPYVKKDINLISRLNQIVESVNNMIGEKRFSDPSYPVIDSIKNTRKILVAKLEAEKFNNPSTGKLK